MKLSLRVSSILLIMLFAAFAVQAQDAPGGTPQEICDAATPAQDPENRQFSEAETVLEEGVDYRAVFCTDAGPVYIDLLEDYAPITVNNLLFLAQNGYYNNIIFHRVIEDFMAQGGDPTGTGTGGPGYQFGDEPVGFLTFTDPGILAMANAGPGTNGSQFFITTAPTPHLNYRHTIYGIVLEGQDNVENILLRDPSDASSPATTLETVVIIEDPESVVSDYENTREVPDAGYFTEGLLQIEENSLPPDLIEGFEAPIVMEADQLLGFMPDDLKEDYAAMLEENEFAFNVTTAVVNATCNDGYFFGRIDYSIDAYGSAEAAEAAIASDAFSSAIASVGFESYETDAVSAPVYFMPTEDACFESGVMGLVVLQRGRYVVTITSNFSDAIVAESNEDMLSQALAVTLPQLFESFIADAYLAELP